MGSILLEAKWIVGIGNSIPINPNFWPKVGSHVFWRIDISRVCNFVDQVASQWNSTLVMLLFASHVTKSIVKKPPRLGIANKLIGPMNLSFLFRVMQVYLLLHSECSDGRSRT